MPRPKKMSKPLTRLKPIPRIRAKTAYGFMKSLNRLLLQEPTRLYMGEWVQYFQDKRAINYNKARPACGTIGCYAGWAMIAKSGKDDPDAETFALDLLAGPTSRYETSDLRRDLDNAFLNTMVFDHDDCDLATPGTKAYAKIVVARFEKIMETHKAELKARRV